MSETDEGSTGFELLDEENTPEAPSTPEAKAKTSVKSKPERLSKGEQKILATPKSVRAEAVVATPGRDSTMASGISQPSETIERNVANVRIGDDAQGDSATTQLNAEMVWSGLQWGASFLSKVTEKAKESVDKVITTLDPQMKPIIFSGGDLSITVASDKKDKVMPIQDAFWDVFGRATVEGVKAQPSSMAAQPVGFTAGLKAAEDRVACLHNTGDVDPLSPVIAVEGFLAELSTDRWFEMSCVLLVDKPNDISISIYTQATPLDEQWINQIKDGTPPDYPLSWCGFAKTVGEVAAAALNCEREDWHEKHTGLPRCATIYQAAKSLAFLYRRKLQEKAPSAVISSQPEISLHESVRLKIEELMTLLE
ncbi:protein PRRC1 [Galendromus occidentalis]|uniref:Protein PRRC1 n=1 Tax=Galendromus occidentalis TaxID=34638 RepID=A0AAJ6QVA7_9ACAR|nr:protein PRRC1 [Galendromus occidentalis]